MTENNETRKDADARSPLGRRSYLKAAAGAAALGLAGVGSAAAAGEGDYDLIEVPAGGKHTVRLGDGDTLENTLIDITASGATYQITAIGSDWTIRNVGVRGVWDLHEKAEPLIASVPDSSASARIENVYLGDGAYDNTYPGATGIYVANAHAGTLEIDRVNIQDFPDNAIYGSSPGDLSSHSLGAGGGGEVHITNSFAANCRASGFRVGTNGSYAKNCVAVGCDRNFWGFYNDTEVVDCDFSDGKLADIASGDGAWQDDATVSVTNTCYGSSYSHSGRVVGESAGTPSRTEPGDVEGVPLTAAEAASGTTDSRTGGSSSGGSDDDSSDDDGSNDDGYLLAFVTDPDANLAGYEFEADGPVEFTAAGYESPSGGNIEGGTYAGVDFVEEVDAGWRAGGITGGGHGDAYRVDGPVTSIDLEQSDVMWVELDGERMSPEAVLEATSDDEQDANGDHLVAFVTEPDARLAAHEFEADGPIEFTAAGYESPSGGHIEGGTYVAEDFVEEVDGAWRAGGVTGGGHGDAYRVQGPITSIDLEQPDVTWVELDGERMSPDDVIEATAADGDGDDSTDHPPHVIVIDGTESDEEVSYSLSVSGSIEKSSYDGASVDDGDVVEGGAIEGSVRNSKDAYWFDGDITDFWLLGNASVDVIYDADE